MAIILSLWLHMGLIMLLAFVGSSMANLKDHVIFWICRWLVDELSRDCLIGSLGRPSHAEMCLHGGLQSQQEKNGAASANHCSINE